MTRTQTARSFSVSAIPICATIAGSDSGGGAGIQADLKTFSALGVYGASVITAITAQNTKAVTAVHDIPADIVTAQIEAVFSDLAVDAVKIGMLSVPATIEAVAAGLAAFGKPVVLDPVMVAKSGDRLLSPEAVSTLRERLLPLATLLTPNLPEAACLLDCDVAQNEGEAIEQGKALLALGADAVLMKGGHADGGDCTDLLIHDGLPPFRLTAPRIATRNTHGTGCTLSSAIAAGLAKGLLLEEAFTVAHGYLQGAIIAADRLSVGSGNGPVHHFHQMWG
ncbi:hydroxymethylpyrimidine/phosphomethylpyrimidine kinase [Paramesorhizobium deserti]|uniref:hydroxymethylpyrimidine kinase n=1 Tax=Paramesorhizobium deserti TaxID=1494590 RepID=A0A135HZY8_9HYPH|nr:bifunctional hydroxymethylpyrimidine kinase/phosphomethylpyrimidine kinase [Paramesorhizobium deserti]KXF78776.1 hydroxymethylpyrimidine/phosphomethylpyrimidine kinase [Paramesorhizobium deserti]